jgi:hypothetical protein
VHIPAKLLILTNNMNVAEPNKICVNCIILMQLRIIQAGHDGFRSCAFEISFRVILGFSHVNVENILIYNQPFDHQPSAVSEVCHCLISSIRYKIFTYDLKRSHQIPHDGDRDVSETSVSFDHVTRLMSR